MSMNPILTSMIGPSFLGSDHECAAAAREPGGYSVVGRWRRLFHRPRARHKKGTPRGPSRSTRTISLPVREESRHVEARRDQRPGAVGWGRTVCQGRSAMWRLLSLLSTQKNAHDELIRRDART